MEEVFMKKSAAIFLLLLLLTGCRNIPEKEEVQTDSWGSFTAEKTCSYDEKYYAIQEVEKSVDSGVNHIKVCIYETGTEEKVFEFYTERARDFWGICWESDTYNIWIQSGDTGVYCYRYEDERWIRDDSAERPEDIHSKYDDMEE